MSEATPMARVPNQLLEPDDKGNAEKDGSGDVEPEAQVQEFSAVGGGAVMGHMGAGTGAARRKTRRRR